MAAVKLAYFFVERAEYGLYLRFLSARAMPPPPRGRARARQPAQSLPLPPLAYLHSKRPELLV